MPCPDFIRCYFNNSNCLLSVLPCSALKCNGHSKVCLPHRIRLARLHTFGKARQEPRGKRIPVKSWQHGLPRFEGQLRALERVIIYLNNSFLNLSYKINNLDYLFP